VALRTARWSSPVTTDWADVPARFGVTYVSVTATDEVFEFKVEPLAAPGRDGDARADLGAATPPGADEPTRVVPKVGYWRVAVALCEPALRDESEHIPSGPEIVDRLDRLGLETEDFSVRAVDKRIRYLYEITGIEPGDRVGLRRRLIGSLVVTLDDVVSLLGPT
jgi:hypothetical protein